ncbi:MAG: 6-phosphofructokinase [Singulisphaera sp.]|nr:6-phosphofructokinase [Singulisphaera sp.]
MANKRIGILTGGGDVPSLNSVIKSVVYRSSEVGAEVLGIRRGWQGLTHSRCDSGPDPEYTLPLNRQNTRTIDRTGGTFLHSSRTNPRKMAAAKLPPWLKSVAGQMKEVKPGILDITPVVLKNLEALKLDTLIAIGGDDTLSYAKVLDDEGFPVICVPKTMDNDVRNTEYCLGFSTAVTRAEAAISRQRTTVGSHERIGIFRIFGRDAGHTALYTAYITSVRCCIPEYEFDLDRLFELLMADKRSNPSNYALVILSEGAMWKGGKLGEYGEPDAYGHRKKLSVGEMLDVEVRKRLGEDTIVSDLTYDLRSGDPDFLDKMVANTFANMAMDCIDGGKHGRMMAVQNGCYIDADIPDPELGPRKVDVAQMYNVERLRPNYSGKNGMPIFLNRLS